MMTVPISSHFISFYRLADNRNWVKASCSCGWSAEGKPAEVYAKAAGHDLPPLGVDPTLKKSEAMPDWSVDDIRRYKDV